MDSASEHWQLSRSAAADYERINVPKLFGPWAQVLVDRAGLTAGERILDLACGTGVVARAAVRRVGPSGAVVGADLNQEMLAEAARRVPEGFHVEWECADACRLPFDDADFDVVLCQQGLQFVADRLRALEQVRRVLRPNGRAVVAVWADIDRNPIALARHRGLMKFLGEDTVTRPFRYGDRCEWAHLFAEAEFASIETETIERLVTTDDPRAMIEGNLAASPIADRIRAMARSDRDAMVDEMVAALSPWITDGALAAPSTTNLVMAHRPPRRS